MKLQTLLHKIQKGKKMNLSIENRNAYTEVVQVLEKLLINDVKKIPNELLIALKENQNPNHEFQFDVKRSLNDQNFSKKARTILAVLFRDYFATEKQRNKILDVEKYEYNKLQKQAMEKYNPDELFSKAKENNKTEYVTPLPAVIKKESFLNRIFIFLKQVFRKK